ncbi:MAG: phosphoglycerate dehydrogenase [Bacteroidetes bacterium CG18_big_fil_WC_8_21_14_2_50_41_14]|nr:MAG: phosphoglycerate dehydrogenase [Bacteroidetes bacterium CG18_big_fil_WC_8_21_14_2_50_41_14]PJB57180.1 MAG: phosphoglycerate dehydrogenase [Bacteroidetes bacterium CG_4_9_14_3_um_filter_41_19]
MYKGKVLFIDTAHPELTRLLQEMGYECDYYPDYQRIDFLNILKKYVGIIIRSKIKIDREILEHALQLRFIARVGAGMENIDVEEAEKRKVICLNAPEGNRDAVAEQAVGMLLTLFNRLLIADPEVRKGVWLREENRGIELGGKTIAIVGYGNTGSAFTRKLMGFDVKVMAYDKYKTGFGDEYVQEASMDQIYQQADIVSFHVPLTSETTYLFDKKMIAHFQKPFFLINTSRGKVVKTADLMDAMEEGKVRGACLDVLEYEGLSFEAIQQSPEFARLTAMKNVILTPHIAGWTNESNIKMAQILAAKVRELKL